MNRPPKKELERLWIVERKSTGEIGKQYGCCSMTVLKWLHYYEISIRACDKLQQHHRLMKRQDANKPLPHNRNTHKTVCGVLKDHAEDLKDDPERLSTEFLQRIIGVKC